MKKRYIFVIFTVLAFVLTMNACSESKKEELTSTNSHSSVSEAVSELRSVIQSTKANGELTEKETQAKDESKKPSEEKTTKFQKATRPAAEATTKFDFRKELSTVKYTSPVSDYEEYDNNSPIAATKIKKAYDESELLNKYLYYKLIPDFNFSGDRPFTFDDINTEFPAECVRKRNGSVYAVYRTNQSGLMYMFFDSDMRLYYCAYSTKKLDSTSFKNIKAGDSFEKVAAVDPAAKAMKAAYESRKNPSTDFYTVHILTDGIYYVYYQKSEGGEYTVWKGAHYSDYILNKHRFFADLSPEYGFDHTDYSYKILAKDYPE